MLCSRDSRRRNTGIRWACRVTVFLIAAGLGSPGANAQESGKRTMTLSGTGEVRVAPDTGHVTIGVVTEAVSARVALSRNTVAMATVIDALKARNIADKDLQASRFSLAPRYSGYERKRNEPPRIVGYRASNQVTVTVRRLEQMGEVMDAATSSGSNSIGAIRFSVSGRRRYMDQARRLATRDALRKAVLYAEEAGVGLGPVTSISEVLLRAPRPRFSRALAMEAKSAPVPVAPGEQILRVQVNMSWRLE